MGPAEAAVRVAETLRASGRRAAPLLVSMSERETEAYAARWGYREIVQAARGRRAQGQKKGRKA